MVKSLKTGKDNDRYFQMAIDRSFVSEGGSLIIGRSFFSPRIVKGQIKKRRIYRQKVIKEYRYYLTIDCSNNMECDRKKFFSENDGRIAEIDITDFTKQQIMSKVEEFLHMSNEDVSREYHIRRNGSPEFEIKLKIHDMALRLFESEKANILQMGYNHKGRVKLETDKGSITQETFLFDSDEIHVITINLENEESLGKQDKIFYRIINSKECGIMKTKFEILDEYKGIYKTYVDSELGKLLFENLEILFKEQEEKQVESITPPEAIVNYIKQNRYTETDLILALLSLREVRKEDVQKADKTVKKGMEKTAQDLNLLKN